MLLLQPEKFLPKLPSSCTEYRAATMHQPDLRSTPLLPHWMSPAYNPGLHAKPASCKKWPPDSSFRAYFRSEDTPSRHRRKNSSFLPLHSDALSGCFHYGPPHLPDRSSLLCPRPTLSFWRRNPYGSLLYSSSIQPDTDDRQCLPSGLTN